MGYDGLLFVQKPYLPWHYEPDHIGINWRRCWHDWGSSPPETVVIYNAEKVASVDLIHDGGRSAILQLQVEPKFGLLL